MKKFLYNVIMSRPNQPYVDFQAVQDWSFVTFSKPPAAGDRVLRRLVRANATRDYWRQKKQGLQNRSKASVGHPSDEVRTDTSIDGFVPRDSGSTGRWTGEDSRMSAHISRLALETETSSVTELAGNRYSDLAFINTEESSATDPREPIPADKTLDDNLARLQATFNPSPSRVPGCGFVDPYNALPIGGSAPYNSFVLSHRGLLPTERFPLRTIT